MIERITNDIFGLIDEYLPEKWGKCILHAIIKENYYSITFYVKVNDEFIQCFDLFRKYNIEYSELNALFESIYNLCKPECDNEDYNAFTLIIEPSGHFTVNYHYDKTEFDLESWEEEYLN